jgi:predicted molibdopterin-dependent oxidoreductase YjgC
MTNSIREIRQADCILITGSNTATAPGQLRGHSRVKSGAHLIIIDPGKLTRRHAVTQAQPGPILRLPARHVILRGAGRMPSSCAR